MKIRASTKVEAGSGRFAFPGRGWGTFLLIVVSIMCTGIANACPVCFSAPNSPETRGMTLAILFLLGLLGIILCGIAAFFMYLVSRQKELSSGNELLPDDAPQGADIEHVVS